MLCPEVWSFASPESNYKEQKGILVEENKKAIPSPLQNFYYSHLVSIVLPNNELSDESRLALIADCDYYKVKNISLSELFRPVFVDTFIKNGEFSALSVDTHLDKDNCACVTPFGQLILNLRKEAFQVLGLEGCVSHFCKRNKERYIVKLNLADISKGIRLRALESLEKRLENFSLIFSWEPPEKSKICPSSVAKYFSDLGKTVTLCKPQFTTKNWKNLKVPRLDFEQDMLGAELLEWVAMCNLEGNFSDHNEYLSSYEVPEPNVICKNVRFIEIKGFFTCKQLQKLYTVVRKLTKNFSLEDPWMLFYANGFSDSPVAWKNAENHFFTSSENAFALFFKSDGKYLECTQKASNKRLKNYKSIIYLHHILAIIHLRVLRVFY